MCCYSDKICNRCDMILPVGQTIKDHTCLPRMKSQTEINTDLILKIRLLEERIEKLEA